MIRGPGGPELYRREYSEFAFYGNVLITFSSYQAPCLAQNPDVHWIGTGALQSPQIWSPASRLGNASALQDHLEPPHGIGACDFLAGRAGTHCPDPTLCPVSCVSYTVSCYHLFSHRIFCHLVHVLLDTSEIYVWLVSSIPLSLCWSPADDEDMSVHLE